MKKNKEIRRKTLKIKRSERASKKRMKMTGTDKINGKIRNLPFKAPLVRIWHIENKIFLRLTLDN